MERNTRHSLDLNVQTRYNNSTRVATVTLKLVKFPGPEMSTRSTPPPRTHTARPPVGGLRAVEQHGERAPTIETVAQRAGVSRQTVSNVINAPDRVRPDTRARVQAAIDDLRYRPSRLGSALQSRSTRSFAYRCHIDEAEENLLLDRFLHELCRAAALRQHHIVLVSPANEVEEIVAYDDMYRTGSVDGFILSGTYPGDPRLDFLIAERIPFASFGRNWDHPELGGWVDIDGAAGVADAVRHFWGNGHHRIAWIGGSSTGGADNDRREGYRRTFAELGGEPLAIECCETIEGAASAALTALRDANPPTAFICATDVAAVGCARAATEMHRAVGAELGIIGFDDTRLALALTPQLSSIRQPTAMVAQLLIDGLIATVNSGAVMAPHMLSPTVIHRGSS